MQPEERQKRIEEYLLEAEFASLEELAKQVDASVSTVRRDVTQLEAGGNIRRTHGGARIINPKSDEFAFSRRDTLQLAEKEAIAKACAGLIQPGQSVIIDAGTTAFHVATHLQDLMMQVITNSLPVANLFASAQRIEVVVSGGVIYPRLGVLVGPLAVDTFSKKLHADVAIMSGGGITLEGVTNSHALLIEIQQAMIHAAGRVIFCLDSTKFGRRSVVQLCELASIDVIVTDAAAPRDLIHSFRDRGVEVIVAGETQAAQSGDSTPATPAKPAGSKKAGSSARPRSEDPGTESSDSRMGWD